jgi:hypothetical protein
VVLVNSIQSIVENLVEWAGTQTGITSEYAYAAGQKTMALPDVAAEIQREAIARADTSLLPTSSIEQVVVRSYVINLMFLVAPDPPDEATNTLTGYVDTLTTAILTDPTCGGALGENIIITPEHQATFTPPFLQFEDGTRGRTCTMELTLAELASYEDVS